MKDGKLKKFLILGYICFSILIFAVVLIIPQSREVFKGLSSNHPYIMGFIKFSLLATAGELIAAYIIFAKPTVPVKIVWRFIIWGLIGVWITFMMGVYKTAAGTLTTNTYLAAFYTSVLMNTSFGPTFMAIHKCTDKILELSSKKEKVTMNSVMTGIDWTSFAGFTILKTVPFFWIPAHTVTFMLPSEYQVIMAATLSIALGIILSFGNRKKTAN